ncbi:MAG: AfsR/SARP family transcriptional regulator, partial [Longimicrobiales bacterium]
MLELVTFGGLSVHGADGCQIIDLPRHLKQLALLSYLAVEARSVTRDELIGLFWPEATEQNARQSLSQALSGLRNALGADAIVTEGNLTRRLAPDIVWPDTAAARRGSRVSGARTTRSRADAEGPCRGSSRDREDSSRDATIAT